MSVATFGFTKLRVLRKEVLNFASLQGNSNKFYIIELQEGTGTHPYCVYTNYGRMGQTPRTGEKLFQSHYEAEREYDKTLRSKTGKGYKVVEMEGQASSSAPVQINTTEKQKKMSLETIEDKVLQLIGKLYSHATTFMAKSVTTPLGSLSANQVAKGYKILRDIEEVLDGSSKQSTLRLSDEFYSIIPVIFGSRVDVQKMNIDSFSKLNDQKDLLGVMESVVQAQSSLEKTLSDKYDALKIKLKFLSSRTKDYKRIKEKVEKSKSKHHRFDIKVTDIYEVEDMVNHDKFNPYKVSTLELFHGSRNENILSIMQNGLRIKPTSAVHSGSMFGSGIYFAEESSKSANYCWGFNGSMVKDKHYLFVCEVATGKIKEYTNAQPQLTKSPYGFNSVLGKKGVNLIHDEYIVYSESQVKVKYIVEFEKK